MVVCAAGLQLVAVFAQASSERASIRDDLLCVGFPGGLGNLEQGGGDTGDGL